ncbi:unnamed protein product [Absidia cylindrospora]
MLSRLKKIFISKKEQRQNQVKVKVFNYTSDMRPLDSTEQHQQLQDQQLPLTPWSKPTKDTSLDLKEKKNSNKKTTPAQQQLQSVTTPQQPPPPPPMTLNLPLAPN